MVRSNLLAGCLLLAAPFARAQEGAASGTITDSHGEAVAYCTVSLRRTADSTVVTGVVSDTLGRYRLAPLSEESCFLEFAHVAYETASRAVPPGRTAFVCDVVL